MSPATKTARTEESSVLNEAHCMLMNENPLFDWSKVTSLDSWLTVFETDRSASSSKWGAGGGVVEDDRSHSSTSC